LPYSISKRRSGREQDCSTEEKGFVGVQTASIRVGRKLVDVLSDRPRLDPTRRRSAQGEARATPELRKGSLTSSYKVKEEVSSLADKRPQFSLKKPLRRMGGK
jgi:hypothetical protein